MVRFPVPGNLLYGYRPGPYITDAPALRPLIIRLKALAEGAQVHVEDVALHRVADMLLGHQRFLGGVHAAHAGAIVALAIARTDALNECNPLRLLVVSGTLDVAGIWSRRREDPLELQRRDDVREAAVTESRQRCRIEGLKPRSQHHRSDLHLAEFFPHAKVDRVGFARVGAHMAIGADAATEAAARFRHGLLLGVTDLHLVKGFCPLSGIEHRHRDLPLGLPTGRIDHVLGRIRTFELASRPQVLPVEPAVDRNRRLLAGQHGRHHDVRTGHAIAANEHARHSSLQSDGVRAERTRFGRIQSQPLSQRGHVRRLSDGNDHRIARENKLRSGDRLRGRPSAGVRRAQLHPNALQSLQAGRPPLEIRSVR